MSTKSYCGESLLLYDQGCLNVFNNGTKLLKVFSQSSGCYECSLERLLELPPGFTKTSVVQTISDTVLKFNNGKTFMKYFKFEQHGHYNVFVDDAALSDIVTFITPDDAYAPLKTELWIFFIIIVLWTIGACTSYYLTKVRWLFQTNFAHRELLNDLGTPSDSGGDPVALLTSEPPRGSTSPPRAGRVNCIDAFRGLTMTLMIFVNYGGGKYWIFEHAPWNGLTFADVVFPCFAFIMGMSQLLSISSLYRNTNSKKKVFLKVFLRSLILFLLGVIFNSFNNPNLLKLRIPGVLQRLGLTYFIVGVIEILCLQTHYSALDSDRLSTLNKLTSCCGVFQWLVILSLLVAHTCIVFLMKVPGCPVGYVGPGGLHWNGTAENCTGGASGYIDRLIFTSSHLYQHRLKLYNNKVPFDPEGLLGTLTMSLTVFLGVCAVRIYLITRSPKKLMFRWIIFAVLCGSMGGMLSSWSQENGIIPINKRLWSLSFTLVTASISFITIFILYFLIDYKKIWNGSPFKDVGKNALFIYFGHMIFHHTFPWDIAPLTMTDHAEILYLNTWSTFLWVIIAVILAKNNIIVVI